MIRKDCSLPPARAAARVVLFVHGSLSSRKLWAPYADALGGRDCVAVDLAGYGDAPAWPEGIPYRLSDAAAPLRSALQDCTGTVDVVAHSFGGAVALRYALENPGRVNSLTLIEPCWFGVLRDLGAPGEAAVRDIEAVGRAFTPAGPDQDRLFAIGRFVGFWNGRRTWDALAAERQEILALKSDQVRRDFEAVFSERLGLAAFRDLLVPTLVVTGTTSPAAALLVADALVRAIPHASAIAVPGAGHMLPATHVPALTAILRARFEASAPPAIPWAA
jgi:pimeloyl-ACP methyl ester carboxylesterase